VVALREEHSLSSLHVVEPIAPCGHATPTRVLLCRVRLEHGVSPKGFDEVLARRCRILPEELQGPAKRELDDGPLGAVGHLVLSFSGELPVTQG
jgi:hypothetical protein